MKLYAKLAGLVDARLNCLKTGNEWAEKHEETILKLVSDNMPHGSGFDSGTQIDLGKSTGSKLVFHTSYHHMNDNGMYDGWTDHTVTVKPSLMFGFDLNISGRDRNGFKEYAYEVFSNCLSEDVD